MTYPPFSDALAAKTSALLGPVLRPSAATRPDPILAAIQRHRAAFEAYEVAPGGTASVIANDDYEAETAALVATRCATRLGALALLTHLRWWLDVEAEFAVGHQPAYRLAQARAADLTLFLGTHLPAALRRPPGRRADRPTAGEAHA